MAPRQALTGDATSSLLEPGQFAACSLDSPICCGDVLAPCRATVSAPTSSCSALCRWEARERLSSPVHVHRVTLRWDTGSVLGGNLGLMKAGQPRWVEGWLERAPRHLLLCTSPLPGATSRLHKLLAGFGHRTGAQCGCLMRGYTLRAHKAPCCWREIPMTLHLTGAVGSNRCVEPLCHLESVHSVLMEPLICQKKNALKDLFSSE